MSKYQKTSTECIKDYNQGSSTTYGSDLGTLNSVQRPQRLTKIRNIPIRDIPSKSQWKHFRKARYKGTFKISPNLSSPKCPYTERNQSNEGRRQAYLLDRKRPVCLSTLSFPFVYNFYSNTNTEITSLLLNLRTFVSLCTLKLNFVSLKLAESEKFADMLSDLKYLTNLSTLKVNLGNCPQITPIDIQIFSKSVKYLISLSNFHLSLYDCNLLINEDFRGLFKNIGCLKSLSTVYLYLRGYKRVNDQSIEILARSLSYAKSLRKHPLRLWTVW